jgi:DNA-binding NarL/FixJ family response regulator
MAGTFLIADDTPSKLAMLKAFVVHGQWDGEILLAKTSEEAFALIDAHPTITAAFVDYYIPSKNGPAIIAYLHAKNPAAHIALVSSADNAQNSAEAKAAGAEAVICTTHGEDILRTQLTDLLLAWRES